MIEMLRHLASDVPTRVRRAFARARGARAVSMPAQKLKGASANVDASALAALCAGMEMRARMGKLDDVGARIEQFDAEFAGAPLALRELLVGSPGGT
jgi:HPt (histidine-containing phosphotransfer) domain-containing protein